MRFRAPNPSSNPRMTSPASPPHLQPPIIRQSLSPASLAMPPPPPPPPRTSLTLAKRPNSPANNPVASASSSNFQVPRIPSMSAIRRVFHHQPPSAHAERNGHGRGGVRVRFPVRPPYSGMGQRTENGGVRNVNGSGKDSLQQHQHNPLGRRTRPTFPPPPPLTNSTFILPGGQQPRRPMLRPIRVIPTSMPKGPLPSTSALQPNKRVLSPLPIDDESSDDEWEEETIATEMSESDINKMKRRCPVCRVVFKGTELFMHCITRYRMAICIYCRVLFPNAHHLAIHLHRSHRVPFQSLNGFQVEHEDQNKEGDTVNLCVDCTKVMEPANQISHMTFLQHKCARHGSSEMGKCVTCGSEMILSLLVEHMTNCTAGGNVEWRSAREIEFRKIEMKGQPRVDCADCGRSVKASKASVHKRNCLYIQSLGPEVSISKLPLSLPPPSPIQTPDSDKGGMEVSLASGDESIEEKPLAIEGGSSRNSPAEDLSEEIMDTMSPQENIPLLLPPAAEKEASPPKKTSPEVKAQSLFGKDVTVTVEPLKPLLPELKDRRSRDNSCRRCGDKISPSQIATHIRSCNGQPSSKVPKVSRRNSQQMAQVAKATTESQIPNQRSHSKSANVVAKQPQPVDLLLVEQDTRKRILMMTSCLALKLQKGLQDVQAISDVDKFTLILNKVFLEMSDTNILQGMIRKSSPSCTYCRQTKLIRVDKRQLVIHLLLCHDWEIAQGKLTEVEKKPDLAPTTPETSVSSQLPPDTQETISTASSESQNPEKSTTESGEMALKVEEPESSESNATSVQEPTMMETKVEELKETKVEELMETKVEELMETKVEETSLVPFKKSGEEDSAVENVNSDEPSKELIPLSNSVEELDLTTPIARNEFSKVLLGKIFLSTNIVFTFNQDDNQLAFGDKPCECLLCGFSVDSQKNLFNHWRRIHPNVPYKCVMCEGPFLYAGSLFSHLCVGSPHPFTIGPRTLQPEEVGAKPFTATVYLKYQCGICKDVILPGFFNYMIHLRKDHCMCELCLETVQTQAHLERHMKKHKLNGFCWKCDHQYIQAFNLNEHLFWKHGTESEDCSKCMKKKWPHIFHFCNPPATFKCDICSLTFSKAKYLRVHSRFHSGLNLKTCSACPQKFVSKSLVDKHFVNGHIENSSCDLPAIENGTITMLENSGGDGELEVQPMEQAGAEDVQTPDDQVTETVGANVTEHDDMDAVFDEDIPLENITNVEKVGETVEGVMEQGVDPDLQETQLIDSVENDAVEPAPSDPQPLTKLEEMDLEDTEPTPAEKSPLPDPEDEVESILNGATIEDVLSELMESLPPNSPDDGKKQKFSLAEVQGPNLSEDESGGDSGDEGSSRLPRPKVNEDTKETESTDQLEPSGTETLTPGHLEKADEIPSPLPQPIMIPNSIDAPVEGAQDLSPSPDASGPSSSLDPIGSMSPLLPPLDYFNFPSTPENQTLIPTFGETSLPEHIIRENCLHTLRMEHDYAMSPFTTDSPNVGPSFHASRRQGKRKQVKVVEQVQASSVKPVKKTKKKKRSHSSSSSSSSCGSDCSDCSSSASSSSGSSDSSSDSSEDSESENSGKREKSRSRKKHHSHQRKRKAKAEQKDTRVVEKLKINMKRLNELNSPKVKKPLGRPRLSKKCTKSSGKKTPHTPTPIHPGTEGVQDILKHFQNPNDAYTREEDLDTDDSGSEDAFHKRQLTEVMGTAPESMEDNWSIPNDLYLLRLTRGAKSWDELKPKEPEKKAKAIYSLKKPANAPRLKVRNVPIKPLIVTRVGPPQVPAPPALNAVQTLSTPTPNKVDGLVTVKRQNSAQGQKVLVGTSKSLLAPPTTVKGRQPRAMKPPQTKAPRKPKSAAATTEVITPTVSPALAAHGMTKIAGTDMTLESINQLTGETLKTSGRAPAGPPPPKRARMKYTEPKHHHRSRKSEVKQTQYVEQPAAEETLYCICQSPHDTFSRMIGCDGEDCPFGGWFHFECVGVRVVPKGDWFCQQCKEKRKKQGLELRLANAGVQRPGPSTLTAGESSVSSPTKSVEGGAEVKNETENSSKVKEDEEEEKQDSF